MNRQDQRTLYVTDLDGTLLDADSRVSHESASMISRLSRRGALITVATARTPATVEQLLAHTSTTLPAIVMTGAALWHRDTHSYSDCRFFTDDAARYVLDECRRNGINPFIYTLAGDGILHAYHNGPMSKKDSNFVDERRHLPLKRFHLDEPAGLAEMLPNTILYLAMGPRDAIFAVADRLKSYGDCSVSAYVDIFSHTTGILEVFAAGVSKADAVRRMARRTGATRIVVFGDNINDLPMMEVADVAVAVGNALPEVRDRADVVIGPNTSDAVARYILEDQNRERSTSSDRNELSDV